MYIMTYPATEQGMVRLVKLVMNLNDLDWVVLYKDGLVRSVKIVI